MARRSASKANLPVVLRLLTRCASLAFPLSGLSSCLLKPYGARGGGASQERTIRGNHFGAEWRWSPLPRGAWQATAGLPGPAPGEKRTCSGLPESRVSDEVVFGGEARGGGARAYAQLAVYRVEVPVDGVGAYEELSGHLGVGHPVRHQPQHLDLASAQSGGMRRWDGRLHWPEGVSDGLLHLHRPSLRPCRPEGFLAQPRT